MAGHSAETTIAAFGWGLAIALITFEHGISTDDPPIAAEALRKTPAKET